MAEWSDARHRTRDADAAVTSLFRAEFWPLVRLARQLVDDQQTAEDVVQEAFLSLHRRWARVRDHERAGAYLRAAVVNLCRSRQRRAVRARRLGVAAPGVAEAADAAVIESDVQRRLSDALQRLPRRQLEVLVLRYYLDLSEREIATTLGISAGSVKTHASRGLRALHMTLESGELR